MAIALPGIAVSRGYAVGRARIWHHGETEVLEAVLPERFVEDEVSRYRRALTRAKRQLRTIRDDIPESTSEEIAEFFDAHLLMLDDSALAQTPVELIRTRHCNAEWALHIQQEALVDIFDRMDDDYLKTRRDDVIHVVSRILRELRKEDGRHEELDQPDHEGQQHGQLHVPGRAGRGQALEPGVEDEHVDGDDAHREVHGRAEHGVGYERDERGVEAVDRREPAELGVRHALRNEEDGHGEPGDEVPPEAPGSVARQPAERSDPSVGLVPLGAWVGHQAGTGPPVPR